MVVEGATWQWVKVASTLSTYPVRKNMRACGVHGLLNGAAWFQRHLIGTPKKQSNRREGYHVAKRKEVNGLWEQLRENERGEEKETE